MSLINKIREPIFWVNFAKITLPFFIIVIVISLLINSFSTIFSGDLEMVVKENFANDKWKNFFGYKIVFSVFYGLYITNKNMK